MICAARILSDYIVFLVKVFLGVSIEFRGLENLKKHEKYFIIIDAGMNDFMRPALYNAKHEIIPVLKSKKRINGDVEFVGPICESSDTFLKYKNFSSVSEGSLVAITNVGAYGSTLSSNYNTRPLAAEIIIKKGQIKVIRKRQKISEII